jgi:hypothetical protein
MRGVLTFSGIDRLHLPGVRLKSSKFDNSMLLIFF